MNRKISDFSVVFGIFNTTKCIIFNLLHLINNIYKSNNHSIKQYSMHMITEVNGFRVFYLVEILFISTEIDIDMLLSRKYNRLTYLMIAFLDELYFYKSNKV